jgi:hypothetical protein
MFRLAAHNLCILLGACLAAVFFSASAFAQVKNCEDIEFGGVRLGMSFKQARAGLVKHFNLSPDEAQKKIQASNHLALLHPSLRGKKNPTKAEILHATLETPVEGFDYNCAFYDPGGTFSRTGQMDDEKETRNGWGYLGHDEIYHARECAQPPNMSFSSSSLDLSQPDAVTSIAYVSRTLTMEEVVAKLGSPDPCKKNDAKEACKYHKKWSKPRRSCSWKGKEVELSARFDYMDLGAGKTWYLSVSVATSAREDRKGALKVMPMASDWIKAKGWPTQVIQLEDAKEKCRLGTCTAVEQGAVQAGQTPQKGK